MLIEPTADEAMVLEVRDVPIRAGHAPAWAVFLAAAEAHDRFERVRLEPTLPWTQVWTLAKADVGWRGSTDQLASVAADVRDLFFRSWVDAWLARNIGSRCYGAAAGGASVLRQVRRGGPS